VLPAIRLASVVQPCLDASPRYALLSKSFTTVISAAVASQIFGIENEAIVEPKLIFYRYSFVFIFFKIDTALIRKTHKHRKSAVFKIINRFAIP
jgi:hypothetical protein